MRTLAEIKYQPELLSIENLTISQYNTRYGRINRQLVERLKESINQRGYDENFPILVAYIKENGNGEIIGGGHRFLACQELGIKQMPANIYHNITPEEAIAIAHSNNQNQSTYEPETFLDMAYHIHRLNQSGMTLDAIGNLLGTDKANISRYNAIVNDLSGEVLKTVESTLLTQDLLKANNDEESQVNKKLTQVNWQLTWFRHITPLTHKHQKAVIDRIIGNNGKVTTKQLEEWKETYQARTYLEQYFNENIPQEFLLSYNQQLDNGTYDKQVNYDKETKQYIISNSLKSIIETLKRTAASRLENINCLEGIPMLSDKSIDCLITDPPYGINYKSNRRQDKTDEVMQPIENDSEQEAIELLDKMLIILEPKMKDESHCYIFCHWRIYPQLSAIISKTFNIKNLLIWYKNNHTAGDLKGDYASQYECIIFGTKGRKLLQGDKRISNVIPCDKISDTGLQHPTQKPVKLLEVLLEQSCGKGETIIDPFAGVGSSLVAAKKQGLNFIGYELDKKYYETAKLALA